MNRLIQKQITKIEQQLDDLDQQDLLRRRRTTSHRAMP